jgi:hypothetical protein
VVLEMNKKIIETNIKINKTSDKFDFLKIPKDLENTLLK